MTRLIDFYKYNIDKTSKRKLLKEDNEDKYAQFKEDLEFFHDDLKYCIENLAAVNNNDEPLDEELFCNLYNHGLDISNSSREKPNDAREYIDKIYDDMCELRNEMERYAYDSGEYNVYNDDAYNPEATHEAALDYGLPDIMRRYFSRTISLNVGHEITLKAISLFEQEKGEQAEPEFSGDFDEVQVARSEEENEELKGIRDFIGKITDADRTGDVQQIIRLIDFVWDQSNSVYIGYYDSLWREARDIILEAIDINYSDEHDLDFIRFDQGDLDNDATWDSVYETDMRNLMDSYFDKNDANDILSHIIKPANILFKMFDMPTLTYKDEIGDVGNNIKDDDESGSEFDE